MNEGCSKRLSAVVKGLLGIVLFGIVFYFIARVTGHGIPCVFRTVTGYKCPGCGMTRAVLAIVAGDYDKALNYNVLSLTVVPCLVVYLVYRAIRYVKSGDEVFGAWEYIYLILNLIIVIVYGIYRNL